MNTHGLLAQNLTLPGSVDPIKGPLTKFPNLGAVVTQAIPFIFLFAGIALLIMLILGGFSLLTGATDPKQIEGGKQKITYALVGFFVVFLAYWAVQLIGIMFGLTEFTAIFGGK